MQQAIGFRDAGAGDFPGTTDPDGGLVEFDDLALPPNNDVVPIITSVSLQGDNATTVDEIFCRLARPAGVGNSTDVIVVRFLQGETGFVSAGCRIPVPREPDGTPWRLILTTTGKTVDMSLIVAFEKGMAVVDDA